MCSWTTAHVLWVSNDVPLAGEGGEPQSRELKDTDAYRPIPADVVFAQPLWFTTNRTLIGPEPQKFSVSVIHSRVAEAHRILLENRRSSLVVTIHQLSKI